MFRLTLKDFDRLGIPEAEKTALAGVGAQYDRRGVSPYSGKFKNKV